MILIYFGSFLHETEGTAKRLLSFIILSVCLSIRHDPVLIQAQVR